MISTWFVMAAALAVGGDAAAEGDAAPKASQQQSEASAPSGFAMWWFGGQQAVYENSGFLGLSWTYGRFNGGNLEAQGIDDKAPKSEGVAGTSSTWTQGLSFEVGKASNAFGLGKHVGLLAFGLNGYWTDSNWMLTYAANPPQAVSLYGGSLRFFQPRARYVFGRLDLSAQVGPAVHIGVASAEDNASLNLAGDAPGAPGGADALLDTSIFAGLGLEGQASLRFYPMDFFYVEGAYRHSFQIVDFVGAISGMHDWHMGLGLIY